MREAVTQVRRWRRRYLRLKTKKLYREAEYNEPQCAVSFVTPLRILHLFSNLFCFVML